MFLTLCILALHLMSCGIAEAIAVAAPSGCSNCVAVPAVWDGFGYLFNITVGKQELTVISDWTWMSLFVRSGRCMGQFNPPLCVGDSGQAYFDEQQSATFRNASVPQICWPLTAFAPNFTVDYGADTVCVGAVCNPDTVLQLSDFPYPGAAIPKVPFGGIYGMAPVTPGLTETFYPANYQSWRAGKLGARVGWNSCATLSSSKPCLGGEAKIVFGGTDTTLYDPREMQTFAIQNPSWLWDAFYPLIPPRTNYWSTPLTGSWIRARTHLQESQNFATPPNDSDDYQVGTLALLDEGSEGLGAPLSLNAYEWLVQKVGATLASNATVKAITTQGSSGYNTANQNWYTVPCNDFDSFPELVYELEGRANYTIPPEDYIAKVDGADSRSVSGCYLNINVWKYGRVENGDAMVVLLGGAFMKRLYVMLDFENLSFGFAPLRGSL